MLFYSFESLDDFIENNLISNIQSEKNRLNQIIVLYEAKRNNLDILITNLINHANKLNKNKLEDFYSVNQSLKNCLDQLEQICTLVQLLQNCLTNIISLHDINMDNNYNEIKAELIEYNKKSDQLYSQIFDFEKSMTLTLSLTLELFPKYIKKHKNSNNIFLSSNSKLNIKNNVEIEHVDNSVLLISEKDQKAYLPYYFNKIEEIFMESNNKYKTLQDVVNTLYVLPLNKFKNSSIARFREAFQLIRQKEKGSISKALDLALELMFKYDLNPIVIAACRNLDELDIYLDCLDKNELYEFPCFKIKFEVAPQISKSKSVKF